MKLHFLYCGRIATNTSHVISDGSCDDINIPVAFNLIEHPSGVVLFDGGNAAEAVTDPIGHFGEVAKQFKFLMAEEDFVVRQVIRLGFDPEDIKYIVQSHLHLDHSGALGQFPNAEVIVQEKELQYALNPDYFQKNIYIQKDIRRENNWHTLNGFEDDCFDLFGDGVIKILFTPGHTIGHQSMLVNMPDNLKIVLVGDAVHLSKALDKDVVPAAGLYYNAEDYVKSVNRLRLLRKEGSKLFVGHDPDEFFNKPFIEGH